MTNWKLVFISSVASLALASAIGVGLAYIAPKEMYKPAAATIHPTPAPYVKRFEELNIPPCNDMSAKDCMRIADQLENIDRLTKPKFYYGPHSFPEQQGSVNTVPEPSTILLMGLALVGLYVMRRKDTQ